MADVRRCRDLLRATARSSPTAPPDVLIRRPTLRLRRVICRLVVEHSESVAAAASRSSFNRRRECDRDRPPSVEGARDRWSLSEPPLLSARARLLDAVSSFSRDFKG